MKFLSRIGLVTVFASLPLLQFQLLGAEEKPLPKEELAAFMAREGVAPIPVKPDSPLTKDHAEAHEKWLARVLLDPFEKRMDAYPDYKQAVMQYARKTFLIRSASMHQDRTVSRKALGEEADAVLKLNVDDPLIYCLAGWAKFQPGRDLKVSIPVIKKALDHPKLKECSPYLRYFILRSMEVIRDVVKNSLKGEQEAAFYKDMVQCLKDAALDPATFGPGDEAFQEESFDHVFEKNTFEKTAPWLAELSNMERLPEWTRLMLGGKYDNEMAWRARGHGWASSVTEKGWKTFGELEEKASVAFTKAWELHPERPEAAAQMIGLDGLGDDHLRMWFDRAVTARFDYPLAYSRMLNYYLPRWAGSRSKLMAFGMACVMTERYDTEVPQMFLRALDHVLKESPNDWRPMLRNEVIAAVILKLNEYRLKDVHLRSTEAARYADNALLAWACGDYHRAAEALQHAGPAPAFDLGVLRFAAEFRVTEREVRGDTQIHEAGAGEAWDAAEDAYQKGQLDEAESNYQKVAQVISPNTCELLAAKLNAVRLEKALATGEWTPLKADPQLSDWEVLKGSWEGAADGQLINHKTDGEGLICLNARVGNHFEIRGEYTQQGGSPADGMGVVMGYGWAPGSPEWELTWITAIRDGNDTMSLMDRLFESDVKDVKVPSTTGNVSFDIICQYGRITCTMDGKQVYTDQKVGNEHDHQPLRALPGSRIGFGSYRFHKNVTVRLLHAEVRLLP